LLAASGLQVGQDFFLAFSPERVDPGNKRFTTRNTNKVVGGVTPACLEINGSGGYQTVRYPHLLPRPRSRRALHPDRPLLPTWKAREYDFHTRFIELAGEINVEVSSADPDRPQRGGLTLVQFRMTM
jgi:UDP-N-acetyl-D-mannosaminuronate dehydrogenase